MFKIITAKYEYESNSASPYHPTRQAGGREGMEKSVIAS